MRKKLKHIALSENVIEFVENITSISKINLLKTINAVKFMDKSNELYNSPEYNLCKNL